MRIESSMARPAPPRPASTVPDVWLVGEQAYPDLVTIGQSIRGGAIALPPEGLAVARAGIDLAAAEKSRRKAALWNSLAGVCTVATALTAVGGHLGLALGFGVGLGVSVVGVIREKGAAVRHATERAVLEKGRVQTQPGVPATLAYHSDDGKNRVLLDPRP